MRYTGINTDALQCRTMLRGSYYYIHVAMCNINKQRFPAVKKAFDD